MSSELLRQVLPYLGATPVLIEISKDRFVSLASIVKIEKHYRRINIWLSNEHITYGSHMSDRMHQVVYDNQQEADTYFAKLMQQIPHARLG